VSQIETQVCVVARWPDRFRQWLRKKSRPHARHEYCKAQRSKHGDRTVRITRDHGERGMECFDTLPGNKRRRPLWLAAPLLCGIVLGGCQRAAPPQYVLAPQTHELDPDLRQAVEKELVKYCGTPSQPKLLGGDAQDTRLLARGAELYRTNCQQCHGVSGDGSGEAAAYLVPRPRDFRRGIFKFTSTPYGFKPRREDLLRTIDQGVVGTAMPSFRLLPKRDREAVVEYVLALAYRGELEQLLVAQADAEGELTDEATAELVDSVLARWKQSADNVVEPATRMPAVTAESIAEGKAAFQKRECFKCHGLDGRGGLAGGIEVGNDAWGRKDPAADLTSGMLHGGQLPLDVYRRISSGINGTPMPAFKDALAGEPETIWHLTHYVLSLADQRRRGVQFPPGTAAATPSPAQTPPAQPEPRQPAP
jgi:mono/diheme cytochrome c family protein